MCENSVSVTGTPIQEFNEEDNLEPLRQNRNENDINGNRPNTKSKLDQTISANLIEDQLISEENVMEPIRLKESDIINGNEYELDIMQSLETNDDNDMLDGANHDPKVPLSFEIIESAAIGTDAIPIRKCKGYSTLIDGSPFCNFPLHRLEKIQVYFENGRFHSKSCFQEGYLMMSAESDECLINSCCSKLN